MWTGCSPLRPGPVSATRSTGRRLPSTGWDEGGASPRGRPQGNRFPASECFASRKVRERQNRVTTRDQHQATIIEQFTKQAVPFAEAHVLADREVLPVIAEKS